MMYSTVVHGRLINEESDVKMMMLFFALLNSASLVNLEDILTSSFDSSINT